MRYSLFSLEIGGINSQLMHGSANPDNLRAGKNCLGSIGTAKSLIQ